MPDQTTRKSITRSIRMDKEMDSMIRNEAQRLGITPNALINKVMAQYMDVLRYDDPGTALTLSKVTFTSFINEMENQKIDDIGYELGKQKVKEHLLRRGMEINRENIFWYIDQLDKYGGWFSSEVYERRETTILHLKHNYGIKWGYFLSGYVSSMIHGELGLKVQSEILENAIHITITK